MAQIFQPQQNQQNNLMGLGEQAVQGFMPQYQQAQNAIADRTARAEIAGRRAIDQNTRGFADSALRSVLQQNNAAQAISERNAADVALAQTMEQLRQGAINTGINANQAGGQLSLGFQQLGEQNRSNLAGENLADRRLGLDERLGLGDLALRRDQFDLDKYIRESQLGLERDQFDLSKYLGESNLDLSRNADSRAGRQQDFEIDKFDKIWQSLLNNLTPGSGGSTTPGGGANIPTGGGGRPSVHNPNPTIFLGM